VENQVENIEENVVENMRARWETGGAHARLLVRSRALSGSHFFHSGEHGNNQRLRDYSLLVVYNGAPIKPGGLE
jgi:hypothetical protein